MKLFQEALDNPQKLISESEGVNGVRSATITKNIVMCRLEVEKLLTELYQSNFRAQIEVSEMEAQLEWKSKNYPILVQGKSTKN